VHAFTFAVSLIYTCDTDIFKALAHQFITGTHASNVKSNYVSFDLLTEV